MNFIDRIKNPIAWNCIKAYSPPPTQEERFVTIIGELADLLADKKRQITGLLAKVDDLAQELAVTQSQLEDARKRLER